MQSTNWILLGLILVSVAYNIVLLSAHWNTKLHQVGNDFTSNVPSQVERTHANHQKENVPPSFKQDLANWQVYLEKNDDDYVASLKTLGMPDAMVHSFAIGRVKVEELEHEEQLLFDTPYWRDSSNELALLRSQSEERIQSLSLAILGEEKPDLDAIERIRRRYALKHFNISIPRHQQASGIRMSLYVEQLRKEEMQELSAILSKEELIEYELKHSSEARRMSSLLKKMHPSKDEFTKIMQMESDKETIMQAMSSGTDWADNTFNEDQWDNFNLIVEQLESDLGKDRFNQFNRTQLPMYRQARAFQIEYSLNDEAFDRIIQIGIEMIGKGNLSRRYSNKKSTGYKPYQNELKRLFTPDTYQALVLHMSYFFPIGFFEE